VTFADIADIAELRKKVRTGKVGFMENRDDRETAAGIKLIARVRNSLRTALVAHLSGGPEEIAPEPSGVGRPTID
jgi:hypothetical protein